MRALQLKQRGAALAFSLVMLLMLTLVSVSMIQQNKAQISMSNNSTRQTQAFSTAQAAILKAQQYIETQRYSNKATFKCNSTNQLNEQALPALGLSNVSGSITEVYCLHDYNGTTGTLDRCLYQSGARNLTLGVPTPTAANVDACRRLNRAGVTDTSANHCNTEVYTVNVNFLDSTSGSNRTIESKFEVNCAGDIG